ncbi:MAG: tetratricopeptide repeat protein [Rhodoferax sp.]|nr:tetratricopeptide repeat protein [Rhodoferax sp.]
MTDQQPSAANSLSRPLRVGYVSADLYTHPVGLFIEKVLCAHDTDAVQPVIYSNSATVDDLTRHLQQVVQHKTAPWAWRDVRALDDGALAAQIRTDQIDILVDLSGHTGRSRLSALAWKPAPVQISWLGYFATTGLPTVDFVILDPWHAPKGTEAQFSERIIRLPHNRFCYAPVPFAPEVSPAPAITNGYITFGSFNNTAKLNDTVLETWAQILSAVPASRLILKWRACADGPYRQRMTDFFVSLGVAAQRLELRPMSPHRDLLGEYADIDIALDPFPFSGGHTSCEALWMGVPIVTWPQERVVSRQTWSFLNNIGLPGLAAHDREGYVRLAVKLANSPDTLRELRSSLRERMATSPLCDVAGFTRLLEEAYRVAWRAVMEAPKKVNPATLHQRGVERLQAGDAAGAAELLRQAITLDPSTAIYHSNLAVALKGIGSNEERIALYRRALELNPQDPITHANLAAVLSDSRDYAAAEQQARTALALAPERFETWLNLGGALAGQKRWKDAAAAFDSALKYQPHALYALDSAAKAHRAAGQLVQAVAHLRMARSRMAALPPEQRGPLMGPTCHALGEVLAQCLDHAGAEQSLREALQYQPDDLAILTDLGNALCAQVKLDEAEAYYRKVIEAAPHLPGAQVNMGTLFQTLGRHAEAIAHYRAALAIDPTLPAVYGNLGTSLTYSAKHGPADLKQTYDEFDRVVALPLLDARAHSNNRNPGRALRVGYVSPDFRRHAVAYFALPLLEGHHRDQVEVVCYYNHRQDDEWTQRFKALATSWVSCVGMDDATLAQRIRSDDIDILVDLAGHTEGGRLLTFARKPAPVQVTWMGYVTTTGLSAMDYRVTHADADPMGVEAHYSEQLVRLPGTMWCYRPLPGMPEVSPLPLERNGHVTFGSFNRYSKNSRLVLQTWAKILNQVPESKLLICVPEGSIRQQMVQFFAEHGVKPERLLLFAKVSHEEFWKLHAEVDIALDPFPFGGGTTTCETLWLGVPLVSVTGSAQAPTEDPSTFPARFASRMGQAFLTNIGLPELVATTLPQYVDIAVKLAHDTPRMMQLRQTLRPLMAAAPLTDEARFVREMEAAYRAMWRAWLNMSENISTDNRKGIRL